MRKYGPCVAQPKGKDNLSFGYLAVAILNVVLRPVLARWHPLLLDYESSKESSVSSVAHEREWDKYEELREVLSGVRGVLMEYAKILAEVADVPSLVVERDS